jgi:hypothetical protein
VDVNSSLRTAIYHPVSSLLLPSLGGDGETGIFASWGSCWPK